MNLERLCRLCSLSKPNTNLENIFAHEEQLKNSSIDLFIMNICNVHVSKDDNLPHNICIECKRDVINFAQFIKKCQDSDKKLQNIFKNTANKFNPENDDQISWKKTHKRKYKIRIMQKKDFDSDLKNRDDGNIEENETVITNLSNTLVKCEYDNNINANYRNLISLILHISKIVKEQKLCVQNNDIDLLKKSPTIEPDNILNDDSVIDDAFSSEDDSNNVLKIDSTFICKICGVSLCSKSSLRVHQATHSSERPFECDKCDMKFKLKSHLVGHRRNIHEGLKKHCCKTCHKTFFGIAQLKIHMMSHTKEYPHLCTGCGKRFSQQCYLRVHQKMHSGVKDLCCDFCAYTTGNQSAMKMHVKGVHEIDKKYQCAHCGLRFMYPSGLSEHMTIHTGVKKHQCTVCDRKFRTSSSLKEHKRIHSDEKPYKCRYCEKLFRIIGHRTVHERIHTGEKPYTCIICSKGFQTRSNMNAHQKIHNKAQ